MTTTTPLPTTPPTLTLHPGPPPAARLLRLVLLGEAVLAAVTTVEAAVVGSVSGAPLPVLLTLALAVALFAAARSAGRGRNRRWVSVLQWGFLLGALVDVVVAALTSMAPPLVTPVLVRLGLPVAALVLSRRAVRP